MNRKVNLFIIGVNKAGTTWLYHILKSHEEICFSDKKELNYFNTNYPENLEKYHSHFNSVKEVKYFAEGSPSYIRSIETAKNILDYNPNSKIIIMLRDPIIRLLSQFYFRKQIGKIAESITLNQILKNKKDIIIYDSHYEKQLPIWLKLFPKKNIKILSMENCLQNKQEFWYDIVNFLNIKMTTLPVVIKESKNITGSKKFRILYKSTILPIKNHFPEIYQKLLKSTAMKISKKYFIKKFGKQKKQLDPKVLELLKKEFETTYKYLSKIGFRAIYNQTRNNLENSLLIQSKND